MTGHEGRPSSRSGSSGALEDEQLRAARTRRREAAKLHHPDRGGDPAAFARAMESLDRESAEASGPGGPEGSRTTPAGLTVIHTTALSRTLRIVKKTGGHLIRGVRQHIPRSMPASRRYGRL